MSEYVSRFSPLHDNEERSALRLEVPQSESAILDLVNKVPPEVIAGLLQIRLVEEEKKRIEAEAKRIEAEAKRIDAETRREDSRATRNLHVDEQIRLLEAETRREDSKARRELQVDEQIKLIEAKSELAKVNVRLEEAKNKRLEEKSKSMQSDYQVSVLVPSRVDMYNNTTQSESDDDIKVNCYIF